jgi:hypothetical protein
MGLFSSNKSSTTNQSTTNQFDQRQVNDAGGGIVGSGNQFDQSIRYTDSRTSSTTINNTDGGAFALVGRVADGVADTSRMQTLAAERIAGQAGASSKDAFALAQRAQADAAGFNLNAANRSFDLARSSSAAAFDASSDAMGFARDSFGKLADLARTVVGQAGEQAADAAATASGAYQAAADTGNGNKTLVYAALGVVAVAALAFAFKR